MQQKIKGFIFKKIKGKKENNDEYNIYICRKPSSWVLHHLTGKILKNKIFYAVFNSNKDLPRYLTLQLCSLIIF